MPDAGSKLLALDFPAFAYDEQGASFDCTNTSFGTTATGGSYVDCACTFTAPSSGAVLIHSGGRMINSSSTSGTLLSPEVRTGDTIGAGTIVDAAGDNHGPANYGSTFMRFGISHPLTGLTPGNVYNARLLHRVSAGTGSIAYRTLIVIPVA